MATAKVLLYGDVDLNIIDGSAVWLPSVAEAWTKAGAEVHVQLKAAESRDLLTGPLRRLPGVTVHSASLKGTAQSMTPEQAGDALVELDAAHGFDVVMVRGIRICLTLASAQRFGDKLWSYVTEYGYAPDSLDEERLSQLAVITEGSRLMMAQTPQAQAVLEALVPAAAGRTVLLGPMIPDELGQAPRSARRPDDSLRLIYAGKFAKDWRTDLMPGLVEELRGIGVDARLTMVGDKVHREPGTPGWAKSMRALMDADLQGVTWAGAVDRETSLGMVGESDISLGWRSEDLDLSLEISTKVLESSAQGVVSVINRTVAHEELFGSDYPLFVEAGSDTPADIARRIQSALPRLDELEERVRAVVEPYRVSSRGQDLRAYLRRVGIGEAADMAQKPGRTLKVAIAGHDLKFAGELIEMLRRTPDVELRIDHWKSLHDHDEAQSLAMVRWADVVICEWAGSNAVWYSTHKRSGQRLIVRLHMFELRGWWMKNIRVEQVDRFIAVSELYRGLIVSELGVAEERVTLIPNAVSVADLDRPRIEGAEYRLGLIGIVPLRKRLDRAVDLLRLLRAEDDRFTLHIRGRMPWEYRHEWRKPEQRESYLDLFSRIGADPVGEAVAFEPFGADMGNWYRKIGWVLSPSTTESFHLAPAEGMVSGGLPLLWDRPGVRDIYGDEFVIDDAEEAAGFVIETLGDESLLARRQERARAIAGEFDEHAIALKWAEAVRGD